jgi:hypothetical protein
MGKQKINNVTVAAARSEMQWGPVVFVCIVHISFSCQHEGGTGRI